jgi:hypothetical protein
LALRIPHFAARFSFDWDSSQYARGLAEFNVVKHQPHPPGYPLWVLSARALTPLTGGPMQAQTLIAFLMTLLGLAVFYALARQMFDSEVALTCTVLLAYSPAVALNSSISSSSIVDLVSSSVAGYLAFLDSRRRQWRIVACFIALGVLAGFRQSGLGMLAPLVASAALIHLRHAWRAVSAGVILGLFALLAWYIPLARSVGGWHVLSELTSKQFHITAQGTSVFFGGSALRHLGMIATAGIYFVMNFGAWLLAFGVTFRWRAKTVPGWWRYALWMAPTLVMVFAIHVARVGQCLLIFPPLLLLCALIGRVRLAATLAAVIVSLAISYFPYDRFQYSRLWPLNYIFYRSTPRMALDLEASQRNLDRTLRALQPSAPQPLVCVRDLPEAPNIRTVTYDFAYLNWVTPDAAPRGRSIWLFDQHGPNADLRQRYQAWRRILGDHLISLWEAAPDPAH